MVVLSFFVGVLFTLTGCASTDSDSEEESVVFVPGVKLEIVNFDIDLVEKHSVPTFLNKQQTKQVMQKQFEVTLKHLGLLAEEGDQNVAKISVFIDYRRRFWGDETPFPSSIVTKPYFYYQIAVVEASELSYLEKSKEKRLLKQAIKVNYPNVGGESQEDINNSISVSAVLAFQLKSLLPEYQGYQEDKEILVENPLLIKALVAKMSLKQEQPAYLTEQYIVADTIQALIDGIKSTDADIREDTYEKISEMWLNDKRVLDLIEQRLLVLYNSVDSTELDEAEEAIEAITASGVLNYQATLETISREATSKKLQEYAMEGLDVLKARNRLAIQIHKPLPVGKELAWQERQLYNMVNSGVLKQQKIAVKKIYRDYPKNEILLDTLSDSLDSSTKSGYRAGFSSDYHAWICRVLGSSENVKYKSKLDHIAIYAVNEKVRDYAEDYADELDI